MKSKVRFIVIWAIITVIITVISIIVQSNLVISVPKAKIYQAAKQLSVGDTIKESDLKLVEIDLTQDSSNYVHNLSDAVGKRVKQTIYESENINKQRLVSKSDPDYFFGNSESRRFSIPTNYIDDPYSLTFRAGDIVDILFTPTVDSTNKTQVSSEVVMQHVTVVGAIDNSGELLSEKDKNTLATAILFESNTGNILQITAEQYKGKFKFVKYPLNS